MAQSGTDMYMVNSNGLVVILSEFRENKTVFSMGEGVVSFSFPNAESHLNIIRDSCTSTPLSSHWWFTSVMHKM